MLIIFFILLLSGHSNLQVPENVWSQFSESTMNSGQVNLHTTNQYGFNYLHPGNDRL